jgi:DNA-binding NtrC family response regulator
VGKATNSKAAESAALTVLIVDDDEAVRDSLSRYLKSRGWHSRTASSADEALQLICNGVGDIVLSDICMPGKDGLTLLREIKAHNPAIEVLLSTAFSSEDLAIGALKAGAFDYFRKPLDGGLVVSALERTRRFHELRTENARLKAVIAKMSEGDLPHVVFGESRASQDVLGQIRKVAEVSTATVLLTGESGVGKEVAARLIHRIGHQDNSAPFVAMNCGGIPETLLESELFGHEKGAYTGAHTSAQGVFEMAKAGTVLLDEISEMSSQAQTRFLRVIEERRLRRLGGTREIDVSNTRVIATSNRDLKQCVRDGEFREDLYYRIQVAVIHIPPLRERKADILPLAYHFLEQASRAVDRKCHLSSTAEAALLCNDFPGNIRELRNLMERAVIFAPNPEISVADLGLPSLAAAVCECESGNPIEEPSLNLGTHEIALIRQALARHPDNIAAAARALGISSQALYRRLEKYGLQSLR